MLGVLNGFFLRALDFEGGQLRGLELDVAALDLEGDRAAVELDGRRLCRKRQLAGIELEGKGLDEARIFGVVDVHVELLADQAQRHLHGGLLRIARQRSRQLSLCRGAADRGDVVGVGNREIRNPQQTAERYSVEADTARVRGYGCALKLAAENLLRRDGDVTHCG